MNKKIEKQDWINAGLAALKAKGFLALRAEPLANQLGVTRGSFYWHFASVKAFEKEVLNSWRTSTTQSVIKEVSEKQSPHDQLTELLVRALTTGLTLDRQIRAWAVEKKEIAMLVSKVDKERLSFLESILKDAGVKAEDVPIRAELLYWASLGRLMTTYKQRRRMTQPEIQKIVELALS